MATRRDFISTIAGAGIAAATSVEIVDAAEQMPLSQSAVKSQKARTVGVHIRSVIRREETLLRRDMNGDNWCMSWAADDRQYLSLLDGFGWPSNPKQYNSRLLTISGSPQTAIFEDVAGYPDLRSTEVIEPRYYGFGTLALDGRIYQYLCTNKQYDNAKPASRFIGAKLIYSPDNGRTWCNQNGSTPVAWEPLESRSRDTMAFFEESQEAFSLLAILQMGKNYEANRDGYVYVYAPNGNTDGTMNELVMFRVLKANILNRTAYEYFSGRRANGNPVWTKDIEARGVVHTFPRGWVNRPEAHGEMVTQNWLPSVVYNAPLGLYMMTTWGIGSASDGHWFGKPSYFGVWISPNAWGPWTQVHEEIRWLPGSDPAARAYAPQISPKWIAEDGKSFWLIWSDFQQTLTTAEAARRQREIKHMSQDQQVRALWQLVRQFMPNYTFNAQRVDLVVA
jgi:hypothetical protein